MQCSGTGFSAFNEEEGGIKANDDDKKNFIPLRTLDKMKGVQKGLGLKGDFTEDNCTNTKDCAYCN